jgi:hypothetical protein
VNIRAILDVIVSHAQASGLFETVNGHEPKSAPGAGVYVAGVHAAVWVQAIGPVPAGSGLQLTTGRVVFNVRVYTSAIAEPQDAIDPAMVDAVDALMAAYSGDFELGGNVRCVDLLGQAGNPLSAQAGYLEYEGARFRVMTITLPVLVNDLWEQEG